MRKKFILFSCNDLDNIDLETILNNIMGEENVTGISSGGSITGISLDSSSLIMDINGNATIKVKYEGESDDYQYYVKVDGKYYKVEANDSGIKIAKTPSKIESSSDGLSASSNSNTVTVGNISGTEVPLTSGTTGGTATITVKYGEYEKTCIVSVVKRPVAGAAATNSVPTFSTDYGLVDVIWLKAKTNNCTSEPNTPILNAKGAVDANKMTPVTWTRQNDGTWKEYATAKSSYYSYNPGNGTEDNLTSEWANAKNKDGSYFVWIPRFAYRITYYSDAAYTNVTGFWDGNGLYNAIDGKLNYENDAGIETADGSNGKYIVHPAFGTDLGLGGWDNGGLEGFWVAKYEMSKTGATESSSGSGTTFFSLPSVQSARSITIGNMYNYSKLYDTEKESHLMKNSEWGAVALLTQSQYGRNGHEIDINNSTTYVTGNGGGAVGGTASTASGVKNYYNTETGAKASTTGNIYGVYDMSGGAWEYVAAYDSKSSSLSNGSSFASTDGTSTKYATAYQNGTTDYNTKAKLFEVSKMGDATKEVRQTSSGYGWHRDYSNFVYTSSPFFKRGGYYSSGSFAGVFYSPYYNGNYGSYNGFRAVLCP